MAKTCSIEGCERKHHARGMCNIHYLRVKQYGRLELLPTPTTSERFWSHVERSSGCWTWTGVVSRSTGYGIWHWSESGHPQTGGAHRYAYEDMLGEVPPGLVLDHLCGNRACVRPDHLEPVTQRENTLRSDGPTAVNARKTECYRGHPFDSANTLVKQGRYGPQRICRACARDDARRRRRARAAA